MSSRDCTRCSAMTLKGKRCRRSTCKYSDQCHQHTIKHKKLQIKTSQIPNSGNGLYTTQDIKKGQVIVPYGGKVITIEEYRESGSTYGIHINKKYILDGASTQSGLGRWANSCTSRNKKSKDCRGNNAKIAINAKNMTANLKATRNISSGEEIFLSYGRGFWS